MSPDQLPRPSLLAGAGHLAALWALAFAQPLLDLLGRNPDFFVARGNTAADIVVFAVAFTLLPPLLMLGAEAIAQRIGPSARWGLHLGLVGLLAAALALQVVKALIDRPAGLMIAAALAAGAGVALLYVRARFLRSLLDVLIAAPVVVLAVFLLFSETSELVFPGEEAVAAEIEVPRAAPVVFVIFDELPLGTLMTPQGGIDASRFPAFAELARSSTWYRGATAAADSTPRAVPALLTGALPDPDDLPTSDDQPRSLFTLLGGSYRVRAAEQATRLCPASVCEDPDADGAGERLTDLASDLGVVSEHLLLPDALRRGLPSVDQTFGGFANEAGGDGPPRFAVNDQLQLVTALEEDETDEQLYARFLAGIDGEGGTLDFVHLYRPHYPWTHFPDGSAYSDLTSELKDFFDDEGRFLAPPQVTDLALQRHLLETGYTDLLLGHMIDRLREVGAWRRSLVIVASDHGAAFIPGDFRRVATHRNLGQMAPIPLFVKGPGQLRGRVVDRHTCATQVLPLLADSLSISYPWERPPCPPDRVEVARIENAALPDGTTTDPTRQVAAGRRAFVHRIDRLFGSGTGWAPVLAGEPGSPLLGRQVSAFPQAAPPATAEIEDSGRFYDGPTPLTLLRGELSTAPGHVRGEDRRIPLVVAVNGTIVAVGRSFTADDKWRFSLLFPPAALRPGVNVVELFTVVDDGDERALALLGSA